MDPLGQGRLFPEFLRNRFGERTVNLVEHKAKGLGSALQIGQDALSIPFFVIGGSRVGIAHAVSERVVEEHSDFSCGGGDRLGLADPS